MGYRQTVFIDAVMLRTSRLLIAAIMIPLAPAFGGCGEEAGAGPCQDPPTFARDIAPLSNALCVTCHAPNANRRGAPPNLNFDDWPSVEPVVEEFADSITSGRMPPIGFEPTATAEDRRIVRLWRTCGFRE